jgi:hypothetical protein
VVARSRWASPVGLLVCRPTSLVVFKILPRGPAVYGSSVRDESSAPEEQQSKEQSSPVYSTRDQFHLSDERGCRTAGVRERLYADAGCHSGSRRQESVCCEYKEERRLRERGTGLSACAASEVALGESRLRGSQASLNSNCQKTGESTFHLRQHCTLHATFVVNALQQYEWLVSLATAKLERR